MIAKGLSDFIKGYQDKPVVWGASDCSSFCAAWVARQAGQGVKLPDYKSRQAAHDLIAEAGGLYVLWHQALEGLPVKERLLRGFDMPQAGDVGIVNTGIHGEVGVIFTDFNLCLWRAETGFAYLHPRADRIVAAWSF